MARDHKQALGAALAALALGLGACGGDSSRGPEAGAAEELAVYASVPLQGAQRSLSEAMVNGMRLRLEQSRYRAGRFAIRFEALDDSTAEAANWDPGQTASNARRAVADRTTIAYLGEFNSGASATSIPILNQGGIPQVSPGNTAVGLTTDAPGADVGEPQKYYPAGARTYLRVVPNDRVQGAAMASLMADEGCRRVFVVHDPELYGVGLARNIQHSADEIRLRVLGNRRMNPRAGDYRSLARTIQARGADCVGFAGTTPNNAVQLFKDLAAGVPGAKLFGTDGVAEPTFGDAREGGVPREVAERMLITAPTLAPSLYPKAGQEFVAAYVREYGARPEPWAIYGYESMDLVLDAIERAGVRGSDRKAVLAELRSTRDRASVLGTYDIDENGDTTLTDYGVYRISGGRLEFDRRIRPRT
ncbi:MAG: branched-chain amino acid ABC transporter substrate-binding protein [Solirubrobacteraceae bacterium]